MKPAATVATLILIVVGFVHLVRLVVGIDVLANGVVVPMWVSAPAALVALGTAIALWRESRAS